MKSNTLLMNPNVITYYFFEKPLNSYAVINRNFKATVHEHLANNKQTFTHPHVKILGILSLSALSQRFKNSAHKGSLAAVSIIIGFSILTSGCDSSDAELYSSAEPIPSLPNVEYAAENNQQSPTISSNAQSRASIDYPGIDRPDVVQATKINNTADAAASQIIQSLQLSKARLAAQSRHKCPKLLNSSVGFNRIVRSKDLMVSDHCDYYIYPIRGSTLHVESEPRQLKSVLIAPEAYDFRNGGYKVERPGKYIIRVYDTSIEPRNKPIDYDVTVSIH